MPDTNSSCSEKERQKLFNRHNLTFSKHFYSTFFRKKTGTCARQSAVISCFTLFYLYDSTVCYFLQTDITLICNYTILCVPLLHRYMQTGLKYKVSSTLMLTYIMSTESFGKVDDTYISSAQTKILILIYLGVYIILGLEIRWKLPIEQHLKSVL